MYLVLPFFSNVTLLCPMDREVIDINTVSKEY